MENEPELQYAQPIFCQAKGGEKLIMGVEGDILTNADGLIYAADSIEEMQNFCEKFPLLDIHWDEPLALDIDAFLIAINGLSIHFHTSKRRCSFIVDNYNLLDDIAITLKIPADKYLTNEVRHIIDGKLFWGCNLPSVTPKGKVWHPHWSKKELLVLKSGVNTLITLISQKQPGLL